jgi:hypothetical protein
MNGLATQSLKGERMLSVFAGLCIWIYMYPSLLGVSNPPLSLIDLNDPLFSFVGSFTHSEKQILEGCEFYR